MILSKANQLMRNLPKEDLQFITTPKFNDMKERVLIAERVLLQTISFDLMVEHPYRHLKPFAMSIPVPTNLFTPEMTQEDRINAHRAFTQSIVQRAWNFVNDRCGRARGIFVCLPLSHLLVPSALLQPSAYNILPSRLLQLQVIWHVARSPLPFPTAQTANRSMRPWMLSPKSSKK